MITLSGGPYDGQTHTHANGDYIELSPLPAATIDFSMSPVDPIRFETVLYRRSMRNPDIFVFQP